MSECYYNYKFYFSSDADINGVSELVDKAKNDSEIAEKLGFLKVIDAEKEHLDHFQLKSNHCVLSFTKSVSADLNHRLIRASKEIGSEFCIVEIHNNQVGEDWEHYLFRGREVEETQLDELLQKFEPHLKVREAIEDGDLTTLNRFVKNGLSTNQKIDGQSLLEIAMRSKQLNIFRFLLNNSADVNVNTNSGESLILYAAKNLDYNDTQFAQLLLAAGADFSQIDDDGGSVLWYMGKLNRKLRKVLAEKQAVLSRPSKAYSDDDPLDNLEYAAKYYDKPKISEYFKICVKDRDNWPQIASVALRYDFPQILDALFKLGFLSGNINPATIDELIRDSLEADTVNCFVKLLDIAESNQICLESDAEDYLYNLVEKKNTGRGIARLIQRYPSSVKPSALNNAIYEKRAENLKLLLNDKKILDDFQKEYESSIFHYHLDEIDANCAQVLIDAGANILEEEEGKTVIEKVLESDCSNLEQKRFFASFAEHLPVAKRIFIQLANNDFDAFQRSWNELENKNVLDHQEDSIMIAAVKVANAQFIEFLAEHDVDVHSKDSQGNTALAVAVDCGRPEIVAALLSLGASANDLFISHASEEDEEDSAALALLESMGMEDLTVLNEFMKAQETARSVTAKNSTCLMLAASRGDLNTCKLLMKKGADLWKQNDDKQDAIMYAILNGHQACTEFLVKFDVDKKLNDNPENYICNATLACNSEALDLLVKRGLPVNLTASDGEITPLILATISSLFEGDNTAFNMLLSKGAKPGNVNNEGKTPLIYACIVNNQYAIKKLLAVGGFPSHVDKDGKTAFDYFQEGEAKAEMFSLEDLQPKDKLLGVKKALVRARKFLVKILIPSYIALSIVAIFSQNYATKGLYLVGMFIIIKFALNLKKKFSKPKEKPKSMIEKGLFAIADAMESNEKKQRENQAIIQSWND